EENDLGVEVLQRLLELLGVTHLDDAIEVMVLPALVDLLQRNDPGVCASGSRIRRVARAAPQDGEVDVAAQRAARDHALCALRGRCARGLRVGDLDDEGDPVPLRDRLAEPTVRHRGESLLRRPASERARKRIDPEADLDYEKSDGVASRGSD